MEVPSTAFSKNTSPLVGVSSPPSSCRRVDLPLPLAPVMARYSPVAIERSTPRRASIRPSSKLLHRLRASSWGLVMAKRLHRREMRAAPRGNGAGNQSGKYRNTKRLQQMQRRNGCGDDARGLRQGREQPERAPSYAQAENPPGEAEHDRFRLDEQHDAPALPAQRAQDADLACPLEDRHRHGIGDAQNTHQQGDRGGAPGGGMCQQNDLVIAGALSRRNGVQTGQGGLDLGLGSLEIMIMRFAGRRRAKPHMKRCDLSFPAGEPRSEERRV